MVLQLFRLEEKSTSQKLDLLFTRSLYPIAIGLAQTERLDSEEVAGIHKQYGDHLYAKGEFESATKSYVKTLGWVQPSYVIRKVSLGNCCVLKKKADFDVCSVP